MESERVQSYQAELGKQAEAMNAPSLTAKGKQKQHSKINKGKKTQYPPNKKTFR